MPATASQTVIAAVLTYAGENVGDLDLETLRDDVEKIVHGHELVGAVHRIPRGHHGACDIEVYGYDDRLMALVVLDRDGNVHALPWTPEPTALERADASRRAATRANVTVYYRGRATTARRVEPLQNGFWRADLPGGMAALYETDPTDDPNAVQRST